MALFTAATTAKTKPERMEKASEFATAVIKAGLAASFHQLKINDLLNEALTKQGKTGGPCREGALYCVNELCTQAAIAPMFLFASLANMMELQGDKLKPVATAAKEACDNVVKVDANMAGHLLPALLTKVISPKANVDRFEKIGNICKANPKQVAPLMSEAITIIKAYAKDVNSDVAMASRDCLKALCAVCPNPDMAPFLPALQKCLEDEREIPETVFKMASTTFVADVDSSTLSIMAPVLFKGLQTTSTSSVKRQSARIIENFCKLVNEPRFLGPFTMNLQPLLDSNKVSEKDPECRGILAKAAEALSIKTKQGMALTFDSVAATKVVAEKAGECKEEFNYVYTVVTAQATLLNEIQEYTVAAWEKSIVPVLTATGAMASDAAKAFVEAVRAVAEASREEVEEEEVDDGAEVLCDLNFGLAYGNKVLLRKTKLKLLRGHRYGLLGQNDSGKTSLLQALADYKVEGFPSADECRTIFVATDIKTELADLTVIEYMFNDPLLKNSGVTIEQMEARLLSVGFKEGAPATTKQKVGTLSGGWRMKLALSRAMLLKADILLLDEPTNHLDTYNVKWVEAYLLGLSDVTSIMVSHDSGLLTRVCTKMVEIHDLKLRYHHGNLESLVAARPEAKHYFELAKEGKFDFNFPCPGPLPGVKSKGKAILRMDNIKFTYPGVKKAQLVNVSVQVSLSSRVACVGENGAGKSTMIKLLTGELEPDEGSGDVVKHPNCRVGYIAQHAFHHIENFLDISASEYVRQRYANGGDNEELVKVTSIPTAAEIELMESHFEMKWPADENGKVIVTKEIVEKFTERRRDVKTPKGMEYEVQFKNKTGLFYVNRKVLEERGFTKRLNALDERIALRATQFARPLTKENVEKHLADVGLAAEFGTHMRIGALSGGQKVKVVLAAALWSQPHILILDEPTNYLDRESLGALARAIHRFEGGVVMITHNSQFCDNLCPVVWHLQNNTLDVKGDAEWMAEAAKKEIVVSSIDEESLVDKFGNTIEIKKVKKLTSKEKKEKARRRAVRYKETGDDYDSAEDEL
jgi:elongation factor 3